MEATWTDRLSGILRQMNADGIFSMPRKTCHRVRLQPVREEGHCGKAAMSASPPFLSFSGIGDVDHAGITHSSG